MTDPVLKLVSTVCTVCDGTEAEGMKDDNEMYTLLCSPKYRYMAVNVDDFAVDGAAPDPRLDLMAVAKPQHPVSTPFMAFLKAQVVEMRSFADHGEPIDLLSPKEPR